MGYQVQTQSFNVTASGVTSTAFRYDECRGGQYTIPAVFTSTTVSFKVSGTEAGTFTPVNDATNTLITQTVSVSTTYSFPPELRGAPWVMIVPGTSEGTARTIPVTLTT
jgi:hypothetical protein